MAVETVKPEDEAVPVVAQVVAAANKSSNGDFAYVMFDDGHTRKRDKLDSSCDARDSSLDA